MRRVSSIAAKLMPIAFIAMAIVAISQFGCNTGCLAMILDLSVMH